MYVHGSEERLIQAARGDRLDVLEAATALKKAKKEKRMQDWEEKALDGQYLTQTKKQGVSKVEFDLVSVWRSEEAYRKSVSCSSE